MATCVNAAIGTWFATFATAVALLTAAAKRAWKKTIPGLSDGESSPRVRGSDFKPEAVTTTLYLVRHGEAIHNIAEREAKTMSAGILELLGLSKGSECFEEIVEGARHQVLMDEGFKDAALSGEGCIQASASAHTLEGLYAMGLAKPETVYVSPLQRALKTASIMFPNHHNIHVCSAVRERLTGLPCDESSPTQMLQRRLTFDGMIWESPATPPKTVKATAEDKAMVRLRAEVALRQILAAKEGSVAIVSHKGFLRELEKGCLAIKDTAEFDNGEVRVYHVQVHDDGAIAASCVT
eukprot:CAMPEP_0170636082 /NCGR_PEP_ID=MMETSP0224-20130122/37590_1 /TAXON_ID=285029 /ORGANISM="Togula jolla, Strain CCCM 725" /LENGTH=294 /DNA_ID=CAMNT_0010965675 /DNA_START=41 /DNA_END=925 /DNA_ORIENTATION=+